MRLDPPLAVSYPKARKEHECFHCGGRIDSGERYVSLQYRTPSYKRYGRAFHERCYALVVHDGPRPYASDEALNHIAEERFLNRRYMKTYHGPYCPLCKDDD